MQFNLNIYLSNKKSDIKNFAYNVTGWGYDINFYQNIELKGDWKFSMNGFIPSVLATCDFSLSAKKSLLNKKLLLATGYSNILKKRLYNYTIEIRNVSTDWTNRWETHRFTFSLGITSVKAKK